MSVHIEHTKIAVDQHTRLQDWGLQTPPSPLPSKFQCLQFQSHSVGGQAGETSIESTNQGGGGGLSAMDHLETARREKTGPAANGCPGCGLETKPMAEHSKRYTRKRAFRQKKNSSKGDKCFVC